MAASNGGIAAPSPRPVATINPPNSAPIARSGRPQPVSGTRTIKVKAHTRTIKAPAQASPTSAQPADPFAAQVNSAAQLKYGPASSQLNQSIVNSQYNQLRVGNWYTDYLKNLASQQAQSAQQADNLAHALTGYNPQAAQTGNAAGDAKAAQAAQAEKYLGQAFAGTQGQLEQNTSNQLKTVYAGAGVAGANAIQGAANQTDSFRQKLASLLSTEGAYKTQVRNQLQSQADKNSLAQQKLTLAQDIYGNVTVPLAKSTITNRQQTQANSRARLRLSSQRLQNETAKQRHDSMLADNRFKLDQQKLGYTQAKDNYERTHSLGPYRQSGAAGGISASQVRKGQANFRSAIQALKSAGLAKRGGGAQAAQALGIGVPGSPKITDPLFARTAALVSIWGGVDKTTANQFQKAYGFRPPIHAGIK